MFSRLGYSLKLSLSNVNNRTWSTDDTFNLQIVNANVIVQLMEN